MNTYYFISLKKTAEIAIILGFRLRITWNIRVSLLRPVIIAIPLAFASERVLMSAFLMTATSSLCVLVMPLRGYLSVGA